MDILNFKKSKLRQAILKLYFFHPERRYYLRELERILGKPVSYVRREMMNLEKNGIFTSEFQGKERYFSLNKKFPLYGEIENIISKTIGVESSLKKELRKISRIESAFIFGSFARKDKDELSDLDLIIIGNPDEDKLISIVSVLENKIDREINYHIFSSKDIKRKIKQKNSFIDSVFNNPKIFLIGDGEELSKFS